MKKFQKVWNVEKNASLSQEKSSEIQTWIFVQTFFQIFVRRGIWFSAPGHAMTRVRFPCLENIFYLSHVKYNTRSSSKEKFSVVITTLILREKERPLFDFIIIFIRHSYEHNNIHNGPLLRNTWFLCIKCFFFSFVKSCCSFFPIIRNGLYGGIVCRHQKSWMKTFRPAWQIVSVWFSTTYIHVISMYWIGCVWVYFRG